MSKFCKSCGAQLNPSAKFCGSCGTKTQEVEALPTNIVPPISMDVRRSFWACSLASRRLRARGCWQSRGRKLFSDGIALQE